MFYGNDALRINNVQFEDAFDNNEEQSLNEAILFVSKEAKETKKKIKEIIKEEFAEYNSNSLGSKIKGALTGANKAVIRAAYEKALKRIITLVNGKYFGPCRRERAYTTGYSTVYETYYVTTIYSTLRNNKMIKIEYEYDTTFFFLSEFECNIPKDFVRDVLNSTNTRYDLRIDKKSISAYRPNSLMKDKEFANKILKQAQQKGLNATLDVFKSTVKFK